MVTPNDGLRVRCVVGLPGLGQTQTRPRVVARMCRLIGRRRGENDRIQVSPIADIADGTSLAANSECTYAVKSAWRRAASAKAGKQAATAEANETGAAHEAQSVCAVPGCSCLNWSTAHGRAVDRGREVSTTCLMSESHRQGDSARFGVRTQECSHSANRARVRLTTLLNSKSGSLGSTRSQASDVRGSTAPTALALARWRRSFAFRTWSRPKPRPARQTRLRQRVHRLQPAELRELR